jgi:hypothetical protein
VRYLFAKNARFKLKIYFQTPNTQHQTSKKAPPKLGNDLNAPLLSR